MNSLSNCCDHLQWHQVSLCHQQFSSKPPEEALIAPAINLLNPETFDVRNQSNAIDEKVQQIVSDQGLFIPPTFLQPFSITNHHLSMALHFAKSFRQTKNLQFSAQLMQKGANLPCAQTTAIYTELYEANLPAAHAAQVTQKDYVSKMRGTLANTLDLSFICEMTLRYPFNEIFPYLYAHLKPGEYVIPLIDHIVTLVKDQNGSLALFDPENGTLDLNKPSGREWFKDLLQKHKVHINESLSLLKIVDYQVENPQYIDQVEIKFNEPPPSLSFKKCKGRWGTAIFRWRGHTTTLPWDRHTGHIYNKDSPNLIRAKCSLLIPRTWIDTSIRVIYHLARTALQLLSLPFALFQEKQHALEKLRKISESAQDIFRTPFYGLLGTFAAFYGLFKPLDGRRLYAHFERCLNRQKDHVDFSKKHYAAPCFKPWNLGVEKNKLATIENLKRTSLQLEYFQGQPIVELFCGWRRALPCF